MILLLSTSNFHLTHFKASWGVLRQKKLVSNASCLVNNYICVCEIWIDESITVCKIFIRLA